MLDDHGKPISGAVLGNLDEDFDESSLPIIVELHDLAATDARFLERGAQGFPAVGMNRNPREAQIPGRLKSPGRPKPLCIMGATAATAGNATTKYRPNRNPHMERCNHG